MYVLLQRQTTATVAPGQVLSEAFRDERAAWLFHAPSSSMEGTDLFFALPVSILEDSTQLLAQLGCAGAKGFSGVFIWRIKASAVKDGEVVTASASATRVAAVPSTCATALTQLCLLHVACSPLSVFHCTHLGKCASVSVRSFTLDLPWQSCFLRHCRNNLADWLQGCLRTRLHFQA